MTDADLRRELETLLADIMSFNAALRAIPGRESNIREEIAALRAEVDALREPAAQASQNNVEDLEDRVTSACVRGLAILGRFGEATGR